MIFNSIEFIIFFVLFFILYWFLFKNKLKSQNLFLLAGSYLFYAYWNWRFLSLIILSSLVGFYMGKLINNSPDPKKKKLFLSVGLIQGVGTLFFLKYYNFFISSLIDMFSQFGIELHLHSLRIILPIGISFYTFKIISYLIDIYKEKIEATDSWITFFCYVSFFPCLTAGPIDRARTFIPQLQRNRVFAYNKASDGLRQILWGVFKKMVIADNCATYTNYIFDNYEQLPASTLFLGAFFYTIQIYADFSGYSDMAIGIARLLGFEVTKNFDYPYFSKNIAEFWKKWHISLTSWMTEYVFTPLTITFRDWGRLGLTLAVLINFVLIGVWHGANWTYIVFGLIHGCLFLPIILKSKKKKKKKDGNFKYLVEVLATFFILMITLILFRADTVSTALSYYSSLLSFSLFSLPVLPFKLNALITFLLILFFILAEWLQKDKEHGLQIDYIHNPYLRLSIYYILIFCIILFGNTEANQFIYFKF